MKRAELIERIVQIAGDYRKGEIAAFDAKHVEKWVEQFPLSREHQNVILLEVGHMLANFYISRDIAKGNLTRLFKSMSTEQMGNCSIKDVNFLRTQEAGKSQHEILLLADELLQEMHGTETQNCGGSKIFLYLDDCLYSGSKWRWDIKKSAQLAEAKNGATIVSYHFDIYNGGYQYSKKEIDTYLSKKGAIIKPFRSVHCNSDRFGKNDLDIIWPKYVAGSSQVDEFVKRSNEYCKSVNWTPRSLFRTKEIVSRNVFTSSVSQQIVEQAFLAVGAKMFCAAQNPAPSVRPMGFEKIATIGFGTPIVTWRNIANNCPLALWYGDPSLGCNHPLGMWYPLFPRKI